MNKTIEILEQDLQGIRAGRANPHVLDKIRVDYYGTPTPIQGVGNISIPEARIIQITPWDKKLLRDIERAINMSDIGINPTNDGQVIRLVFPELTEERRKELAKEVKKMGEEAKVSMRNIRRAGTDEVKKLSYGRSDGNKKILWFFYAASVNGNALFNQGHTRFGVFCDECKGGYVGNDNSNVGRELALGHFNAHRITDEDLLCALGV